MKDSTANSTEQSRPTRGGGLLEPFLARMRAQKANQLLPDELRQGRILDIGCGSFPYFLSHTYFREKFAVERTVPHNTSAGIQWHAVDLNVATSLPFEDGFFTAITMLAVVEHLDPNRLVYLLQEIHRILHPGGRLVITTPAAWSDGLLHWMARVNLVSKEEIDEHAYAYTLPLLGWYFGRAGFAMEKVRFGYFEMGLNMWATADRAR
jgi:SAM-dependent methyltransferase